MNRYTTITLAAFLGFTPLLGLAADFSDIQTSVYQEAILALSERNIVQGYANGTFQPAAPINRAEFLKILMDSRYPGMEPEDIRCFEDLEVQVPQWYARPVCAAQQLGIVKGYPDGTFQPNKQVNLVEALKMAFLSFGVPITPTTVGNWYEPYLTEARNSGILLGLLKSPAHIVTRGEASSIIYALVIADENDDGTNNPSTPGICGNGTLEAHEQCDDGNTQDSDGCSSICVLVPEPVRIAIVQIDQQQGGVVTTVSKGTQNVPLLKFTAVSGRQDALLTSLTFTIDVGSFLYAQHYTLKMDRNGDGIYETVVQSNGKTSRDYLTFDTFEGGGVRLYKNLSIPFVVTADLVSTLGPVGLSIEFASDLNDYVHAQGFVDGITLTGIETDSVCPSGSCFIRVNTQSTAPLTIQNRGNLTITKDAVPVRSHILVAGTITDPLLRLRMSAQNEPVELTLLSFDGVPSSVDSLLLYQTLPGQTSLGNPIASATPGQCTNQAATRACVRFASKTLVVDPAQDTNLVVVARMKSDQLGAVSGQTVTLSVTGSTGTNEHAAEARGTVSGENLDQNDADSVWEGEVIIGNTLPAASSTITSPTHDVSFAAIESVQNAGPTQEIFVPTGYSTIGKFRITAKPHSNSFHSEHDVVIKALTFRVNAQNVQIDPLSVRLISTLDPAAEFTCTAGATTGAFDVSCTGVDNGSVQSHITDGEFIEYELKANVTDTQINQINSTLQISIPVLGDRTQQNSITWSDESTTFQWVDIGTTSVSGTAWVLR